MMKYVVAFLIACQTVQRSNLTGFNRIWTTDSYRDGRKAVV